MSTRCSLTECSLFFSNVKHKHSAHCVLMQCSHKARGRVDVSCICMRASSEAGLGFSTVSACSHCRLISSPASLSLLQTSCFISLAPPFISAVVEREVGVWVTRRYEIAGAETPSERIAEPGHQSNHTDSNILICSVLLRLPTHPHPMR